jgi:hypothetical protein
MRLRLLTTAILAVALTASCAANPKTTAQAEPLQTVAMPAAQAPTAGAVAPSDGFTSRAEALVVAFNNKTPVSALFLTTITDDQRKGLARADAMLLRMRDRLGPIIGIDRIEAETPYKGRVHVNMEAGQTSFRIGVQPTAPHAIVGMEIGN